MTKPILPISTRAVSRALTLTRAVLKSDPTSVTKTCYDFNAGGKRDLNPVPIALIRFCVRLCVSDKVNYKKYSDSPWLLPMGGLLAINSGCAEIERDTVQLVRISVLEVRA